MDKLDMQLVISNDGHKYRDDEIQNKHQNLRHNEDAVDIHDHDHGRHLLWATTLGRFFRRPAIFTFKHPSQTP